MTLGIVLMVPPGSTPYCNVYSKTAYPLPLIACVSIRGVYVPEMCGDPAELIAADLWPRPRTLAVVIVALFLLVLLVKALQGETRPAFSR